MMSQPNTVWIKPSRIKIKSRQSCFIVDYDFSTERCDLVFGGQGEAQCGMDIKDISEVNNCVS